MRVSEHVRVVPIEHENPNQTYLTPIYIVGDGQVMTIDSGEAMDSYKWMLRGYLAAIEKAEIALAAVTHHHLDHSGNLKFVRERFGADVLVHEKGVPLMQDKLPESGIQYLHDDQVIDLGSVRLRVLETPGHSTDSVCYYIEDEGVLFTGDTMLGASTTVVFELGPYMRSLDALLQLPNLKVICPGHGPLIHDPRERIQQYIDHRNMRERQIVEVLGEGGEHTSWDIMLKLYPEIDTRLRRSANNNVEQHLRKLDAEGRLKTYAGVPNQPDAEKQREQEEHARVRRETIAKAKEYEEEERKAALAAQENPPTDVWAEMPKYELAGRPGE
jgi:glyoxylase-like metal-dependent hydrolase (beta-lactamase superfamily II)